MNTELRFPRISIITPSFNQARYIEQTIHSVLNQDYPNLEYIIIDGGSTDGTVDVVRKYESVLSYWISEPDRGQAHAINKGLERVTGDIIAYLNSDDLYLPGALHRVAGEYRARPDADLFYGRCRLIDGDNVILGQRTGSISTYEEILDLWDVWWQERNFVQPEVFWTKRIMDRAGPFREDLFYVMDYDYWARIFRAGGKPSFIDAELACFRRHSAQKSTQPELTAAELIEVARPLIWEDSALVGFAKQTELKGKWLYHTVFLPEVMRSLHRREARWVRFARLLLVSLHYPQLFATGAFRTRLWNAFAAFKSAGQMRPGKP